MTDLKLHGGLQNVQLQVWLCLQKCIVEYTESVINVSLIKKQEHLSCVCASKGRMLWFIARFVLHKGATHALLHLPHRHAVKLIPSCVSAGIFYPGEK